MEKRWRYASDAALKGTLNRGRLLQKKRKKIRS
jgi:hypothetical protein